MFKKIFLVILLMVFTTTCCFAKEVKKVKSPYKTKQLEIPTKDNFIIKAKLTYPKSKDKTKKYPVVILLHSLGYSSSYWGSFPDQLLKLNFAVMTIDLRGHGTSNKDAKFHVKSWMYFSDKEFQKYPSDVITAINGAKKVKKVMFNKYAIVGADIGANTAVLSAQKMYPRPKCMVLLSPTIDQKGLTLITLHGTSAIGDLGNTPILVSCSKNDKYYSRQEMLLKKFAQNGYTISNSGKNKNGMFIVKDDKQSQQNILNFIYKNLRK